MHSLNPDTVRFFSGQSHPSLATDIASYLDLPLEHTVFQRFRNDNMFIQLGASVRGRIVFIVQTLSPPVSDHLIELLMMLDIARGAGAAEIHAVIPYYSYARSDKKDAPRISITARLVADLLLTAGATHIMTMTLHSPQVHGFFNVPTDPLTARHLFVRYIKDQNLNLQNSVVVSPDVGRTKPAARFAEMLNLPVVVAQKERLADTRVVIEQSIKKQVKGYRHVLIMDDEIATGASILELSKVLIEFGVKDITVICTHGVFAGDALQKLDRIPQITQVITTDTVPIPLEKQILKLTILSVAPVFGEAIWKNLHHESIGDLFSYGEYEADPMEDN